MSLFSGCLDDLRRAVCCCSQIFTVVVKAEEAFRAHSVSRRVGGSEGVWAERQIITTRQQGQHAKPQTATVRSYQIVSPAADYSQTQRAM